MTRRPVTRVAGIVATVALLAVAALCAHLLATSEVFAEAEFSGAAFRAATAAHDAGALQDQADAAVAAGTLIGLSPERLKRTLGPPSRVGQHGSQYVWDLGEVSSVIFGGSGIVQLYVDFDARGRRVESAEVYRPSD
jgi:hypothetical protein